MRGQVVQLMIQAPGVNGNQLVPACRLLRPQRMTKQIETLVGYCASESNNPPSESANRLHGQLADTTANVLEMGVELLKGAETGAATRRRSEPGAAVWRQRSIGRCGQPTAGLL